MSCIRYTRSDPSYSIVWTLRLRRDVQDTVGIQVETNWELRGTMRHTREVDEEHTRTSTLF